MNRLRKLPIIWIACCAAIFGGVSVHGQEGELTFVGRIATIGTDGNATLFSGDSTAISLTDDAFRRTDAVRIYQWTTWARDGRLAVFRTDATSEGDLAFAALATMDAGVEPFTPIYEAEGETYTYASWSPTACDESGRCLDMAILLNRSQVNGFVLERVRDEATPSNETMGTGAPFYSAWSPDGRRLAWHRGSEPLDVYNIAEADFEQRFEGVPGGFLTPAWSPSGEEVAWVAASRNGNQALIANTLGEESFRTLTEIESGATFAWSPDGASIAVNAAGSPLAILDAVNGDVIAQTDSPDSFAFFWSPDGTQIAYISEAAPAGSFNAKIPARQQSARIAWSVFDVATGETRRFGAFAPTQEMAYLLTYFDQFSASHSLWSPDSRALVYAEQLTDGTSAVQILDVTANGSAPSTLSEGVIGIWSYE